METVIFSNRQGSGYTCANDQEIYSVAQKLPIQVNGQTYNPGDKTTLNGFFCRPLEYIGSVDSEAIFCMGNTEDLFNQVWFYQSVYIISDARIFLIYGNGFGRDYNFINNKWK